MDFNEKLFELSKSTIIRARAIVYALLLLTAFSLIHLMIWHWGWHNAATEVRHKASDSLNVCIQECVTNLRDLEREQLSQHNKVDSTDTLTAFTSFQLDSLDSVTNDLATKICSDSILKSDYDNINALIYESVVTSTVELPLVGISFSTADLPLIMPIIVFGLMVLLWLSLRQLNKIMETWRDRLLGGDYETLTSRRLVDLQYYLIGPIFGKWSSLFMHLFLGFIISSQILFLVSDVHDLANIYKSSPYFSSHLNGAFAQIVLLRKIFLVGGISSIYFVAIFFRANIQSIRNILESWDASRNPLSGLDLAKNQ